MLSKKLLMCCGSTDSEILPEAVDFDGTNDYLSRASDFTGNADGKEFTFSAWVYVQSGLTYMYSGGINATDKLFFNIRISGNTFVIQARNSSETLILQTVSYTGVPNNTWLHFLVSVDLAQASSNSKVYINDQDASVTWGTFTNDTIEFTNVDHHIGANHQGAGLDQGRLSHVYLDYTYRDLSVEATRRNWITSDLKPADSATLAALNPIIYFPLTDPTTAHINSGTGGNMTLNGTVALSERGPNQDNCVASVFDGSADYLSKASITGAADGKLMTAHFTFCPNTSSADKVFCISEDNTGFIINTGTRISVVGRNAADTDILNMRTADNTLRSGVNYAVDIVVDMSNQSNCHIFLNNVDMALTVSIFTDDNIDFTDSYNSIASYRYSSTNYFYDGNLGELWFDTVYTDLSTSNPFWDSDTNKPVPVRQVIENTGVTPLIAMPIRGDNAGLNLGSGGNFTVNSGPFTGSRGASEHWARSADFDGSTGYLSRGALTGQSSAKTMTVVMVFTTATLSTEKYLLDLNDGTNVIAEILITSGNRMQITLKDSSNNIIYDKSDIGRGGSLYFNSTTHENFLFFSIDAASNVETWVMSEGTIADYSGSITSDANIDFSGITQSNIGVENKASPGSYQDGIMSFIYIDDSYIDFSSEANRLLFVDAFGYPTDLQKKIDDGEIPEPLIYMKFDDTTALGTNSGTGGNFTVNGTVTAGADVDPN